MNLNLNIVSGSCPNLVQNVREPDHGQSTLHAFIFMLFESHTHATGINRICGPNLQCYMHILFWYSHLVSRYCNRLHSSSPVGLTTDIEVSYSDSDPLFSSRSDYKQGFAVASTNY